MEERLKYVFDQVKHNLTFAEAKNAMLVILNITLIVSGFSFVIQSSLPHWGLWVIGCNLLFLILSTVIVLSSFIPRYIKKSTTNTNVEANSNINPLFFLDITRIGSEDDFLKLIENKKEGGDPFYESFVESIMANSRIVKRKYDLFSCGVLLTISAIGTPIAGIILLVLNMRRKNHEL